MRSTKLVIGGAAAGAIGVRVARSLYGRWRVLPPAGRERIAAFAEDTKEKALSLRGAGDRARAEEDLRASSETLAAALVETAECDPELGAEDVQRLREDLRRELERLAAVGDHRAVPGAQRPLPDIKASRTGDAGKNRPK
jgi:hypothetical protein